MPTPLGASAFPFSVLLEIALLAQQSSVFATNSSQASFYDDLSEDSEQEASGALRNRFAGKPCVSLRRTASILWHVTATKDSGSRKYFVY